MRQQDFEQLSEEAQMEVLYRRGVYVGKRRLGGQAVVLYQVEGFYVEVTYRKYRLQVDCLSRFSSAEGLDPYLAQIEVELFV